MRNVMRVDMLPANYIVGLVAMLLWIAASVWAITPPVRSSSRLNGPRPPLKFKPVTISGVPALPAGEQAR